MATHGVIYTSGQPEKGSIDIWRIVRIGKRIGLSIFLVGIVFLGFIYAPIFVNELNYISHTNVVDETAILAAADTATVQSEAKELNIDSHFSIYIPKIDVTSNIFSNVDSANEDEYSQILKKGIAHAKGTSFPGMGENIFVFSHSTDFDFNVERYNAKFYLLNKLEADDLVVVYFADKKYVYKVFDKTIVEPTETTLLDKTGQEILTLQTCYPPGTSLKRLIIHAKPYTE